MAGESTGILVVVDDDEGTTKALQYVASWLREGPDAHVVLLRVLPRYPRALEAFADVEDPSNDDWIAAKLDRTRKDWIREAAADAAPRLQAAEAQLAEQGVSRASIETAVRPREASERMADVIISHAIEQGCRTIVVGRHVYPWLLDLVHRHLERDLVKRARNHAVWVVA